MTRVKICGVSDPADARRVADLGAWALGMIFWPGSPRVCALGDAEAIGAELQRRLELVGRVRERVRWTRWRTRPTAAT